MGDGELTRHMAGDMSGIKTAQKCLNITLCLKTLSLLYGLFHLMRVSTRVKDT